MATKRELTFRPITSETFQDSHPYGIEVKVDDITLQTFWYTTADARDTRYRIIGNMCDEFLALFDRLLNPTI